MYQVTVVTGPPGSGKTTHVREHRGDRDLVWDMDEVSADLGFRNYPRPTDVHRILLLMFSAVMGAMTHDLVKRPAWIIITDDDHARRLAQQQGWRLVTKGAR